MSTEVQYESEKEMSTSRAEWLRHPLVNIVLGFILTGVLGTAITQNFLDQREQEKLRAQLVIDKKQAVIQFSKINEERRVHGELVLNALRGNANSDELKAAKKEYDKAYVTWSVERPATLMLFRELLSPENYQLVKSRFEESLVGKVFNPIRQCLRKSFAHVDDKAAINKTLEACQIDDLLERGSTCSQALAAAVSDLADAGSEWTSSEDMEALRKGAHETIAKNCP